MSDTRSPRQGVVGFGRAVILAMRQACVMKRAGGVVGVLGPAAWEMTGWLVQGLAVMRLAQLAPYLFVLAARDQWGAGGNPTVVIGLYGVEVAWSIGMFFTGLRRGSFTKLQSLTDVGLAAVCLVAVGRLLPHGTETTGWMNWTLGPAIGAACVTIVVFGGLRAAAVTMILVACDLAGVSGVFDAVGARVANIAVLIGFTTAAWFVARQLMRAARQADHAAGEAAAARQTQATAQARFEERTRQYRLLHDTVLSTLSAIARGGLDHRADQVRGRCRADADFLRGLISAADDDALLGGLPVALAQVGRRHAMSGLRVHHNNDALPGELPAGVVDATAQAVNEALNNVVKHAGVGEAWVTATGSGDSGFVVTVVDRGQGFNPSTALGGLGIDRSLRQRMADIGGAVDLDSAPGQGTRVELRWPC